MGYVVGIDLGTTNSCIAFQQANRVEVIINNDGGRITPSVVWFKNDKEKYVGNVAKRQLILEPERAVHSIKRFMGKKFKDVSEERKMVNYDVTEGRNGDAVVNIDGRIYTPQEISSFILLELKKYAEEFLGGLVTHAVITVPAYFSNQQRQATIDAGTIANLEVIRIINEPTAAAIAYNWDKKVKKKIAVFDFGGGTFDISILDIDGDVVEVIGTRGNPRLGGNDIDQRIINLLIEDIYTEHRIDVRHDRNVLQRLKDAAETAKIELSSRPETVIHLPFLTIDKESRNPINFMKTLTRTDLNSLCHDLFKVLKNECEEALAETRVTPDKIDEVIMVGGCSRIPYVQYIAKEVFQKQTLSKSVNPDEVVACGASIQGGMLMGDVRDMSLIDVTNYTLGFEVEGGKFVPLIPKNTKIPTRASSYVTTISDYQKVARIHILQGESVDVKDNISLGEFELEGIEPAPRGVPKIEVSFSIDSDGICSITAKDTKTNSQRGITIKNPGGLSKKEIEKLRSETIQFELDSRTAKLHEELKNQIYELLYRIEAISVTHGEYMNHAEKKEVEIALRKGKMALIKRGKNPTSYFREMIKYLTRFLRQLEEKVAEKDGHPSKDKGSTAST